MLKRFIKEQTEKIKEETKEEVKKSKMKKIGIVLSILVIAMMLSGVALAAQTSFELTVNDGTARMQSSLRSTSNDAVPYDATRYDYNAIAVHASGVQMTHDADFEKGYVEVENTALFIGRVIFIDEKMQRAKIAEGAENQSLCYDASASNRVTAKFLQHESATVITDTDMVYGVNSMGTGRIAVQTAEYLQQGNATGNWTSSRTMDSVSVRGGMFNLSAQFDSAIPEAPPMSDMPERGSCPFPGK